MKIAYSLEQTVRIIIFRTFHPRGAEDAFLVGTHGILSK